MASLLGAGDVTAVDAAIEAFFIAFRDTEIPDCTGVNAERVDAVLVLREGRQLYGVSGREFTKDQLWVKHHWSNWLNRRS